MPLGYGRSESAAENPTQRLERDRLLGTGPRSEKANLVAAARDLVDANEWTWAFGGVGRVGYNTTW
jgi:hypothetical protein